MVAKKGFSRPRRKSSHRMLWILVSAAVAVLAVAASVVLTLGVKARYEQRLEVVLRRLDEQLRPMSESLERAVERTSAARERGAAEGELFAPGLEHLQRDELTGLRNRRGYEAELEREVDKALRTGLPLSVVLLEVEEPPAVGSERDPEADRVLQDFAALLLRLTRATDTVCRCGADEFGVVLPATSADGARRFQARVRDEASGATFGKPEQMTFSVGLVEWRPNESSDALDARAAAAVGRLDAAAGNGVRTLDSRRDRD